ncbi:MAG: hypothetical protein IJ836_03065 [Spirochaetales bacterium]|nr:hypothetical protein [Spirochaetales bacterium]
MGYNIEKSVGKRWYMKYSEGGAEALLCEGRGRKVSGRRAKGRAPRNVDVNGADVSAELEMLRKRNAYLEMENEFLKKLDALVKERVERERSK